MSLVGYEYSDDEDDQVASDSEESPAAIKVPEESTSIPQPTANGVNSTSPSPSPPDHTAPAASSKSKILSQLPPVQSTSTPTLSKDVVKRAVNGRIQISAPSLSMLHQNESDDSEDEEERARKRFKKSDQGSRLISMLPKPKNFGKATSSSASPAVSKLTSLVPNSVANRSKQPVSIPKPKPTPDVDVTAATDAPQSSTSGSFFFTSQDDDDEDEEDIQVPSAATIPPPTFSAPSVSVNIAPAFDTGLVYGPARPEPETISPAILHDSLYSPLDQPPVQLDPNKDITYKKYIASKFGDDAVAGDIKFVDFDMSKHLSQNTDWLKNITVEQEDHGSEELEANAPNSTARRKNQITFLAYQAKKRETELKNQWAANRMTKSQTRAKYGF